MNFSLKHLSYRPLVRYMISLWPLPLFLTAVQGVMWLNGNSEYFGLPYWISDLDMVLFLLCFGVAGVWVFWPMATLGRREEGQARRLAARYMSHMPVRALKAFSISGAIYGAYLLLLVTASASAHGHELSAPMLLSLLCSIGYCSLVLVPAIGVAITLHHGVGQRLAMGEADDGERMGPWSPIHAFTDSTKRPWLVFIVTGLLPTSLLVLFAYLASIESVPGGQHFIAGQGLLLFVAGSLASVVLMALITRSLRMVTSELARGLEHLRKGRFEGRVRVLIDDDLGALAGGLNTALAGLQEREELKGSLSVAAEIQHGLIPELPRDVPGYSFAALQRPCLTVGGDYYDVIPLSDGRCWLVMADVAGKGYPAALTVANLQAMLQVLAAQDVHFDEALSYINRSLCRTMTGGRFVTLFIAKLQPESHSLLWVNAGHVPPLLQTAEGIVRLKASTPPLGVLPEMDFEVQRIELAAGDRLLAYTDGLTEARQAAGGRMFGEKGLTAWLQARPEMLLEDLPQALLAELCAYSSGSDDGSCSLDDDMTLLCVQRERI